MTKKVSRRGKKEKQNRNNQPQGDSELVVVSDLKETSSTKISKSIFKKKRGKKCLTVTKDLFSTHMEFVKPDELLPHRTYLLTLC